MKHTKAAEAFTLIEMIIAITLFTIFIGFAIATYLTFHRADQEALVERSLMFEAQAAMDLIVEDIKENTIDYSYYNEETIMPDLSDIVTHDLSVHLSLNAGEITGDTLVLRSNDGASQIVYTWDEDAQTLSTYTIDEVGNSSDAVLLHSATTKVSYVNFRIFPDENPYENKTENSVQYQPTVKMDITFSMPGRISEEVSVDLHTSVTSRFYQ